MVLASVRSTFIPTPGPLSYSSRPVNNLALIGTPSYLRGDISDMFGEPLPRTLTLGSDIVWSSFGSLFEPSARADLLEGLEVSNAGILLEVIRETVFPESVEMLLSKSPEVLRRGISSVRFIGETGHGMGVNRDWFAEMSNEIGNPSNGLLTIIECGSSLYYMPNSAPSPDASFLRALGRFMAVSFIQGIPVGDDRPVKI